MTSNSSSFASVVAVSEILRQVAAIPNRLQHGIRIPLLPDSAQFAQSGNYGAPRRAFSPHPRLFALIIAINTYQSTSIQPLRGAEADALSFKEYLEDYLNVPPDHITVLLNKDATRFKIIRGFKQLEKDPRIQQGDPIIIFYAGHGGEVNAYAGWEAGGLGSKIQMLVPYDYSLIPGREVPGIPDRTIGALIDRISKTKGDNITVFLDCCNSASGTRGLNNDTIVRSVKLDNRAYSPTIDQDVLYDGTRGSTPSPQFRHGGLRSHVLIAACGSTELAIESNGHGNFSTALLKLLRTISPDKLRYSDLLTHMDAIPSQNPHCEGENQHRILFDAKVKPPYRDCYPIRVERTDSSLSSHIVLEAGSAHGITAGAEFSVFLERDTSFLQQTALLTVASVMPFSSIMHFPPGLNLNQPSIAVQTKVGRKEDFRLYVPPKDPFLDLFKLACEGRYRLEYCLDNITIVNKPDDAHLAASRKDNKVVFDMMDVRATAYGFNHQFDALDADVDSVASVLGRAGHFYRTLNRGKSEPGTTSLFDIQFYKLQESDEFDESGEPVLYPANPNLNLYQNGNVDFVVEEDEPYGVKIINNSSRDFYAYFFYFDNSDLSITSYYQSPTAPRGYIADFPLKRKPGTLTIGYGSGGVPPFSFTLRPNQDMDVGFLKLFISTKAIDLTHIPQPSPFQWTRSSGPYSGRRNDIWDSTLVPIIQRRRPVRRN